MSFLPQADDMIHSSYQLKRSGGTKYRICQGFCASFLMWMKTARVSTSKLLYPLIFPFNRVVLDLNSKHDTVPSDQPSLHPFLPLLFRHIESLSPLVSISNWVKLCPLDCAVKTYVLEV